MEDKESVIVLSDKDLESAYHTNINEENIKAIMYTVVKDEIIRLRKSVWKSERENIRNFIVEVCQLLK